MNEMHYYGSLHGHTEYSNIRLRDCIIKIDQAFSYAQELGHTVIGFTDHEFIGSWIKIEQIAQKYPQIKAIRGNEIYLCRNGLNGQNYNREFDRYYHFILLAKDLIGAHQIMEISTRAWQRSYMARGMRRVPTYYQDLWDIVAANPGHVIGSTACLGSALATQILRAQKDPKIWNKLDIWLNQMEQIFGKEDFYLEMQPSKNKEQIIVNKKLMEYVHERGNKIIITTDSHYLKKSDRKIHKAFLNSQNGDREVDEFYATTYMMGTEELEKFFPYLNRDELDLAYSYIKEIEDKCEDFSIQKPLEIPSLPWKDNEPLMGYKERLYLYEKIPTLKKFTASDYYSDRQLCEAILKGIETHSDLQNDDAYKEIDACLEDTWKSSEVNNTRWSAYFLNLQNIVSSCWEAGTLVGPSRGSGGGFILLYLLDITQINPLREKTPTFRWRFLNPERQSPLDVDVDIEGGKRAEVIKYLKKVYGDDKVANVATFRTEKSKSAILTAARGLGIDVDVAQYIASLIPADRGQLRSLNQCMFGDEEHNFTPIKQFVTEMEENYPELWEVASNIEGLINGSGIHAGGIIFMDRPFTESTGLMRAPDNTICTQFELHDAEAASMIKMDLLSVEALDKIHNCIDLLCDYGYIERKDSLKETYENVIGIYNLEREAPDMWKMVWNHEIQSLFQMEKQSGINGIAIAHPKNVDELAVLNSVIRLMAPEKGVELPLDMWARYRQDISSWYGEMRRYGLSKDEIEWLTHHTAITDGICESQEGMMSLIQEERLGGNSLTFADKVRKAVAKKQGKLFEECEQKFFETIEEKGCSKVLAHYVWDILLKVQRGYSFCRAHTLAYSFIALQEMNLCYKYPIIFWNCACLISDAGGNEEEDTEEENYEIENVSYSNEMEEFGEEDSEDDIEDSYSEEDCDGYPAEVVTLASGKKKKKIKTTNYGKISAAIGKIKQTGVKVIPPDINNSDFTFSPDIEDNAIRYGLSGITRVSQELIKLIMSNRPYESIEDFINRVKINKPQMINLIKSGAFDSFGDRIDIMKKYILSVSDQKKRITLQNMKMICDFNLLPEELIKEKQIFYFNRYLKKNKVDSFYLVDEIAYDFFEGNFDISVLTTSKENEYLISQNIWDNMYKKLMEPVRVYFKSHQQDLLNKLNGKLFEETWNKYCLGNISHWEMESISCYFHEHELKKVNNMIYDFADYSKLPSEPMIDYTFTTKDGKKVPMYKIVRIIGTVLDRDKGKKSVTLLTTSGVVTVKIFGEVFANYDKRISEIGADGKKHVIEESMFKRGNRIIVCGIKRDDTFQAKKYSRTPYHLVERIDAVNDDGTIITSVRERQ